MNVCYIGLGSMGGRIAKHISRAGFTLTVYNRTVSKAKAFARKNQCGYDTSIKEACVGSQLVLMCVFDEAASWSVIKDIVAHAKEGTIIMDNGTASFDHSKKMGELCRRHKMHFLDGPVSGGEPLADKGQLAMSVGGEKAVLKKINKILMTFCRSITHMGPVGSGQLCKFVNAYGLDKKKVLKVMLDGSSYSYTAHKNSSGWLQGNLEKMVTPLTKKDSIIAVKHAKNKKLRLQATELFAKIINR
jgi:3-hydroxyisobutyrate dehydrogenase-like beta-hydroxyacid dehydrogenase